MFGLGDVTLVSMIVVGELDEEILAELAGVVDAAVKLEDEPIPPVLLEREFNLCFVPDPN